MASPAASLRSPAVSGENAPEPALSKVSRPQVFYPFPPSGAARKSFYSTHFPGTTQREWSDWRWQLGNRITSLEAITQILPLSRDEMTGITLNRACLPLAVTPYYASLLDPDTPDRGLRRCVIPSASESLFSPGESVDPLGEEHDSPTPGLVHRYPNRVLFLVTDFCSTYCRYCTRSRGMGGAGDIGRLRHRWEKALAYIEATPAVQDVLLSGGDALTLPDEALEWLLARVSRIPHVEFVRIGTKVPAVLPQRITKSLTRMLRKYHPLWMSLHFTHPDELTPESAHACAMLADAGIPLGSQTVLLAGVNDNAPTMKSLFQGLLKQRVRPYYLYQCDPIAGSVHFRTPVATGVEIMRALRGTISGYAMPTYVIDAPGGGGKIPVSPDFITGRENGDILLTNSSGGSYRYPDYTPDPSTPQ
jgi:lysine 2,3-aminomutase